MAIQVGDLQGKLELRAHNRARESVNKIFKDLPIGHIDLIEVDARLDKNSSKETKVWVKPWNHTKAFEEAMHKILYNQYLEQEVNALLSAADQIEEIIATVDNIQRGN